MKLSGTIGVTQKSMAFDTHVCQMFEFEGVLPASSYRHEMKPPKAFTKSVPKMQDYKISSTPVNEQIPMEHVSSFFPVGCHDLHPRNLTWPLNNGWLEDEFPFGIAYFEGRTVKFPGCIYNIISCKFRFTVLL